MNENKHVLRYTGENWLKTAGIDPASRKPWLKLQSTFEKLQEIDLIARFDWHDRPWECSSICQVTPSEWIRERLNPDRIAIEMPYIDPPTSGTELRKWRHRWGLTQSSVARKLQIGLRTIQRAEARINRPLTIKLQSGLREIVASGQAV